MEQRVRFILDFDSLQYTMTELCHRYGVSRKTGYKWAQRYSEGGLDGLQDRSRAPHACPHRTPQEVRDALVAFRRKHPTWGPKKLLKVLRTRRPSLSWPAVSTAGEILRQAGLVEPRRRQRKSKRPALQAIKPPQWPNELWSADFKGQFRTGDHQLCYPLTVADRCSRFLLCCQGLDSTRGAGVRCYFERTFQIYGLPEAILTDNGCPFGSAGLCRLSRLSVWWIRLGVQPIRIEPGRPEQNGGHERMHRTLKRETARPPAGSLSSQQQRFDVFVQEFNEERPHEALELRCPSELYRPSLRRYPDRLPPVEYPGHYEVRRVQRKGEIRWQGRFLYVNQTLAGEAVGLEETDDGIWSLYLADTFLAKYDERARELV